MSTPEQSSLVTDLGRGVVAGLAGTVVMTAFQKAVEMPLTGRGDSYAPADFAQKILPIGRKRGRARERLNYAGHFGLGAAWGAAHGLAGHTGLRGQRAVATVFALLYTGDGVLNTALGLYKPLTWSRRDVAIDVVNKLVLAEATGVAFDTLRGRTSAPSGVSAAASH